MLNMTTGFSYRTTISRHWCMSFGSPLNTGDIYSYSIACYSTSRQSKELSGSRQQDGQCCNRRGLWTIHNREEGHWNSLDQPTCKSTWSTSLETCVNVQVDCWAYPPSGRFIYRSISRPLGDSKQGPPLRPRKGQRSTQSQKTFWRVD